MASITVNGTTFNEISGHFGAAGDYLAMPPIGDGALMSDADYNDIFFPYVGGTVVYTKRLGFLGRDLVFTAAHSDSTIGAAYARRQSFVEAISYTTPSFTVSWLDGQSYTQCRLKQGGASDIKTMTLNGQAVLITRYSIRNLEE